MKLVRKKAFFWAFFLFNAVTGYGMTFNFQTLRNSNSIEINLTTNGLFAKEGIRGSFSSIEGEIDFSVANPNLTSGKILLDSRSLHFGYHRTDSDAQKKEWLDSSRFPKISFRLATLKNFNWRGRSLFAEAHGFVLFKESSKAISLPVSIRYLRAERRNFDGKKGDLLTIKGETRLTLKDLGLQQGPSFGDILKDVSVKISLVGASNRIRPLLPTRLLASP